MSTIVCVNYRIIFTICKEVVANYSGICSDEPVGINKPAGFGIVVSGIEVVPAGVYIVIVRTITEGVLLSYGISKRTCYGKNLTPSIVGVFNNYVTISVKNANNIALDVFLVIVCISSVVEACYTSRFIIDEI